MKKSGNENSTGRYDWLDNLRTFMIFLVVLGHGTVTYEKYGMGSSWWIVIDPAHNDVPGILFLILNIFIIATLFFVSGFLTPRSVKSKTTGGFILAKFKRLMIPWVIAVLTLMPVYKALFLYSRGLPQEQWTNYFHWNALWSQNWLWFLPVLFLFDLLYLGLAKLPIDTSKITVKRGFWTLLILSVLYSFGMDYFGLHGWTKSIILDFQNERILIYFAVYLFGALCFSRAALDEGWANRKRDTILHSTGWLPINLYLMLLIYGMVKPKDPLVSELVDTFVLRLSFVLSLAYIVFAMVALFNRVFNKRGKFAAELNANSYGVYIIHLVILGAIATVLMQTGLPALVKLLIVVVVTYVISNLLVSLYHRLKNALIH